MKISDVREKSTEELTGLEKELSRKLWRTRFENETNRLDDTSQIQKLRRDIARVKTVLTERDNIEVMEQALGKEATKDFQPMQPGDVVATAADTQALEDWVGFKPSTPIEIGVERFAAWYRDFYQV